MSEQHQPAPAEKSADRGSSFSHWTEAFVAGDRASAEKLFQQENVRAGISSDEGGDTPQRPVEPPAQIEPTELEEVARVVSELGPEGEALVREWGGPDGVDFAQNVAYARAAVEHVAASDPELVRIFFEEIEHPDGSVTRLADSVSLHRALAEYGRLRAHRDGDSVAPIVDRPIPTSKTGTRMPPNNPSRPAPVATQSHALEDRIDDLTRQQHIALSRGDTIKAQRIDRELRSIFDRQYGNQPIVGAGGRYE
jgi:hypothetical protein